MRNRSTLAIALGLALSTLAVTTAPASARSGEDRLERIARGKVNQLRAANGVRSLRRSPSLTRSASAYASYMLARGYFGHLSSIRAPLRRYSSLGEIILMHPGARGRPATAVSLWAGSSGHRDVMLRSTYRQIGVGKASGTFDWREVTIWVAHVGRR